MVHLVAKGRLSAGTNPRCKGLSVIANASYRSNCKIFTRLFSFILRPVFSQRALVSQTTGLKCEKRSIVIFFLLALFAMRSSRPCGSEEAAGRRPVATTDSPCATNREHHAVDTLITHSQASGAQLRRAHKLATTVKVGPIDKI